jgi:hypothetical protein
MKRAGFLCMFWSYRNLANPKGFAVREAPEQLHDGTAQMTGFRGSI